MAAAQPAESQQSSRPAIDTLKAHAATWGDELRSHEYQHRRARPFDATDEGPTLRVTNGMIKQQERVFDPLLQRYRDSRTELDQRTREEDARTSHLNRAMDVQILREQPFNIVTNASRLDGIYEGEPTQIVKKAKPARKKFVDTFVDYNILSNKPMSEHHWAPPGQRPQQILKVGSVREVPAFTQKDFNIVTNRYVREHDEKTQRDSALNLLEATSKYRHRNKFDPVGQTFNDQNEEDRIRRFQEAHEAEMVERAVAQMPPSYKHRPTAFYNLVNHEVGNQDMLKWMDLAEDERREQYKNRYIMDHNYHLQDMKQDHVENERRLRRIKMDRFREPINRGYNILNNVNFHGRTGVTPYPPYPEENPRPWQIMTSTLGGGGSPGDASQQKGVTPPPTNRGVVAPARGGTPAESTRSAPASVRSGGGNSNRAARAPAAPNGPSPAPQVPPLRMPSAPKTPSVGGSGAGSVYSKPR